VKTHQNAISVFLSYDQKDERVLQELEKHLSVLKWQGVISTWDRRQVVPGSNRDEVIHEQLQWASIILLLVSADFLASGYCNQVEMKYALSRQKAGEAYVVPIIVRPCDWKSAPFAHLAILPDTGKSLSEWHNKDAAFSNIARGIRRIIEEFTRSPVTGSRFWNVPHERNPYFTGRDELLNQLEQVLSPAPGGSGIALRAVLTQTQAIQGPGGIGKTQIALEYAYRSWDTGRYDHILWINAANEEVLFASFASLAELLLAFPATKETDRLMLVKAMKSWLEQCEQRWLLIFDNADDISFVHDFLPRQGKGSILLTTRAHAVGSLGASAIEVENMGLIESAEFLLQRAQRWQVPDEERDEAINLAIALDCFPLALDQAGAYIEETASSFVEYLKIYQDHRKELLARRGAQATSYPDSVATTWSLSFEKVEQANPAAAELLRLCSFLAPDSIPEELILDGSDQWSPLLQEAATDLFTFHGMMEELLKYSLVTRFSRHKTFSVHRLVQAVQMDSIEQEVQGQWAERVVRAVNKVFPAHSLDTALWDQCRRYLDQVQACNELIERYTLSFLEAAYLLSRTGVYLENYAFDTIVESLYRRALEIQEHHLSADDSDVLDSLNRLANLYLGQARYAEAEQLYRKVLAMRQEESGPQVAAALNGLALLHIRREEFVLAEKWCHQALAISEHISEPDRKSLLNTLGLIYQAQGNYAEAEKLYLRVLEIDRQEWEDGKSS
jgi:tetratricopeptide (TPR) repeat protein